MAPPHHIPQVRRQAPTCRFIPFLRGANGQDIYNPERPLLSVGSRAADRDAQHCVVGSSHRSRVGRSDHHIRYLGVGYARLADPGRLAQRANEE